ncbi:MAG: flagellar assembly protein FliX [Rhodospirillaceae bacterium]|nr:flagellar assembly protein FliX [Rhodospirillaceae bacterium]
MPGAKAAYRQFTGFLNSQFGLCCESMKVSNIRKSAAKPAGKAKKLGSAAAGHFAEHLKQAPPVSGESSAVPESAPVAPVASILSVQEVDGDARNEARSRMVHRGMDILDRLDDIRQQILMGAVSRERLENLAETLRQRRDMVDDPRLIAIIDEIELRAEVELAKLTRTI